MHKQGFGKALFACGWCMYEMEYDGATYVRSTHKTNHHPLFAQRVLLHPARLQC